MKLTKIYLAVASLAAFSPFAIADEPVEQPTQGGNLAYVGSNARVGIGYDTETKLRGEAYWVMSEDSLAAWIGEGWISDSSGGLKLNYHWLPEVDDPAATRRVLKLFVAVDQNNQSDQKLTLGGGAEQENLFLGAYLSKAISGRRMIGENTSTLTETITGTETDGRLFSQDIFTTTRASIFERPYDYGLGVRVGRYFDAALARLSGGLDYEWGSGSARQTTASVMVEKFFANSPHSVSVNLEAYEKSGELEQNRDDQRLTFMYRYELGGKSYRPERETRMVQRPAAVVQASDTASAQASIPVKTEKRMVKVTAEMLSDAFFEFDRSKLTPEARASLDKVISTLQTSGYSGNIHLVGHTCDIGTDAYNLKLSDARALSVQKYLVELGKLPVEIMVTEGKGEAEPRYPNTRATRYKNRRVDLEFVVFTEKLEDVALPVGAAPSAATGKPAAVEWEREYIDSEPSWLRRAMHNTTPHKQSVDVYRQEERQVSETSGEKRYANRAPGAQNDSYTVNTGETATLDVLANDSDPDQDALTIASVTLPAHGSASISGNRILYTPVAGFTGQDAFSYTITDDEGASSTAQVTVMVQGSNSSPVAEDDRYFVPTSRDSLLTVLSNDSDPDGDALTIVSFTQPGTGAISLAGNDLVFTPSGVFSNTTFTYTISDGRGGESTATVMLIDP